MVEPEERSMKRPRSLQLAYSSRQIGRSTSISTTALVFFTRHLSPAHISLTNHELHPLTVSTLYYKRLWLLGRLVIHSPVDKWRIFTEPGLCLCKFFLDVFGQPKWSIFRIHQADFGHHRAFWKIQESRWHQRWPPCHEYRHNSS